MSCTPKNDGNSSTCKCWNQTFLLYKKNVINHFHHWYSFRFVFCKSPYFIFLSLRHLQFMPVQFNISILNKQTYPTGEAKHVLLSFWLCFKSFSPYTANSFHTSSLRLVPDFCLSWVKSQLTLFRPPFLRLFTPHCSPAPKTGKSAVYAPSTII